MSNLQERVKRLSEQQKLLLAKRISRDHTRKKGSQQDLTQNLVAYLVASEPINTSDLRHALKDRLPEFMIPSKFVQLDEMPRLPNGKIDVNALKLPVEENSVIAEECIPAPQTETELKLVAIWEEVLGFRPIRVHDNFFEIGGDSILSIQMVAKARQKGIVLAPNQLFEHQTISELALFAKSEMNTVEEKTNGNLSLKEKDDYSLSNFPDADLNQTDLDNLLKQIK